MVDVPLEWKVRFSAVAIPVVAFGLPAYGVWNFFEAKSVIEWSLLAVVWAGYWFCVCRAPIWQVVGLRLRWACPVAFGVAVLASAPALAGLPAGWDYVREAPYGVAWDGANFAVLVLVGVWFGGGRRPPREPVDLAFPFEAGRYIVVQGGASSIVNRHVTLLDESDHEARGEAFGVDLVELNDWGARAKGLLPGRFESYEIFGRTVLAPLSGEVVHAEGDHDDHTPPEHDPDHPPGNCVWIRDGEVLVLLAHLQQGSVVVGAGDRVEAGEPVARIGNSGRTTEPHLHIHAQLRPETGPRHSGDPLPLAFDGRFPVQGNVYVV